MDGFPCASLVFLQRKMQAGPVEVTRKCICRLQTKQLCGVCVLSRRHGNGRIFPNLCYANALAALKIAALDLGFPRASEWGTHAFRRGWADEALKEGGVTALFYSGGWKGVAAFGYASAKARSALQSAEWLVEFSDSSGSDGED